MIANIFTLSFIIWGIAALFEQGMILESIGDAIAKSRPKYRLKWILKPFILCVVCMPSVWGSAAAWYLEYDFIHWIVLVFASVGLNYIIANR